VKRALSLAIGILVVVAVFSAKSFGKIVTERVEYKCGDNIMEGYTAMMMA